MKEELLTLGVDTSTEKRSVVLMRGRRTLSQCVNELREGGSSSLLSDIERVLASASVGLKEVELFAAAVGPGSFTGLRAGLATLKGLSVVLSKPVVGIPTLHAVAYGARPGKRILALIPAGRGEVFAQMLGVDEAGHVTELEAPAHLQPARLIEKMAGGGGGVKWAGSGAFKFIELIRKGAEAAGIELNADADDSEDAAEGVWLLSPLEEALARNVAALALREENVGGMSSAENLSAIYVRPSDAELKGQWHAQS